MVEARRGGGRKDSIRVVIVRGEAVMMMVVLGKKGSPSIISRLEATLAPGKSPMKCTYTSENSPTVTMRPLPSASDPPPPKRQLYHNRSYSQPAAWTLPEEQDLRPAYPASRAVLFLKQTCYRDSPRRGWDPVEGYHSIVHSRQKEPAERAFSRLRFRERGGCGF